MKQVAYKPLSVGSGKQLPEIQPKITWETLCLLYGTPVTRWIVLGGVSSGDWYTVQQGKVFLMTSLTLSGQATTLATYNYYIRVKNEQVTTLADHTILVLQVVGQAATSNGFRNNELSISPTLPTKFIYGQVIYWQSDIASAYAVASMNGYEIDLALFNQLI